MKIVSTLSIQKYSKDHSFMNCKAQPQPARPSIE